MMLEDSHTAEEIHTSNMRAWNLCGFCFAISFFCLYYIHIYTPIVSVMLTQ